MRIETERLLLREMTQADLPGLCRMLQDPAVMYAWEHAFSDREAQEWLDNQRRRYARDGFGLWAMLSKESGEMIGQCGLTWQDAGGRQMVEVGYLLQKSAWGRGYATEGAAACKEYAFQTLHCSEVCSIIRENNLPSQAVARRNGMVCTGRMVKHYYNMEMPHLIFTVKKPALCAPPPGPAATGRTGAG